MYEEKIEDDRNQYLNSHSRFVWDVEINKFENLSVVCRNH